MFCLGSLHLSIFRRCLLHLLRNDCLPEHTLPRTYAFELYDQAILYPKGLQELWAKTDLYLCWTCRSALICKFLRQPVNSLANFQYYVHERLLSLICVAFSEASVYDLMLIAQARASQIASQQYNKGNVAVRAQDSTELRDAMCVIFAGHKQAPTRETVKLMRPVMVTKSQGADSLSIFSSIIIQWYQRSGMSYSQENMDALFDATDSEVDCTVPCALQICHLAADVDEISDVADGASDMSVCESVDVGKSAIVMEAVGYTKGDHSSLHALAYVLDQNKFLLSYNDPGLMSYLFLHLDPWDIGGFYHSWENTSAGCQFCFVVWNMIQKKEVSMNMSFWISSSMQHNLANDLKDIAPKWSHSTKAAWILRRLQASTKFLRGSAGYKLFNPHDLMSIELNDWLVMIAERPDAAAVAFDLQIRVHKHGPGVFVHSQGRGTLHCHMLLWIAGNLNSHFKGVMFAWLENIISCELPYDKSPVPERCPTDVKKTCQRQPQLAEMDDQSFQYEFMEFLTWLAVECNWHHLRHREQRGDANCRISSIELWRWHNLILFLMQCNTDTQFIAVVFYITEYITKGDVPMYVGLQALDYATKMHETKYAGLTDANDTHVARNLITKSVNAMMGWQETSHQQVMSYLVGGGDYYTSHTFQTFKWFEHKVCQLQNDDVEDDSESMHMEESVTVQYLIRKHRVHK
ncbi:hypothetical protein F4604DRAFT_2008883 [Suillus subluteus]|nr:hypothetical protein F4604DRAFT_2008883 [Suillus subluteus]